MIKIDETHRGVLALRTHELPTSYKCPGPQSAARDVSLPSITAPVKFFQPTNDTVVAGLASFGWSGAVPIPVVFIGGLARAETWASLALYYL